MLGGIGLDLMLTFLAPDDQPQAAALPSVIGGPCLDFVTRGNSAQQRAPQARQVIAR
jgi:hypothetical protein